MVVLAAASSARWRRLVRIVSEWTRSASATEVPKRSVWISMLTRDLMSASAGAFREVLERLIPGGSGPHLQVDHGELLAHDRAHMVDLVGHPYQRLIEPQAGLHADHQHVQHVGQGQLDLLLASLEPAPDEERRADPSDGHRARRAQHDLGRPAPSSGREQQRRRWQAQGQSTRVAQ